MPTVTVPGGTLILPMDILYQDAGMFQAYGLVDRLLAEKIPVMWLIRPGKTHNGTDFVASATDFRTGATIQDHAYTGGPFVIDARHAEAAVPIIQAWQAANATTVHVAAAEFEAPVFAVMPRAPRIAVAQPFADHLFNYLNAAGIPDSAGQPWSTASLDALSPAEVANGALFGDETGPGRLRSYDVLLVPPAPDEVWSDPAALAELNAFVQQGGHLHAFGHAIAILENRLFFLTAEGIPAFGNRGLTGTFTPAAPDWGLNQAVPAARRQAVPPPNPFQPFPSDRTWLREQPGLIYRPGTQAAAYFLDRAGTPFDFMISGPYKGGTCAGRVTYQGGGAFAAFGPYSGNSEAPYVRFVLNSVLFPVARTASATRPCEGECISKVILLAVRGQ